MYLVSDDYGDFKKIMNYKQLYEMLIDEIVEDIKQNFNEYDVLKACADQLGNLAKNNLVNENYIIDNLESYGWHVINILDIQKGINDLREYVARKSTDLKVFDDILKYIDEELK